MNDNRGESTYSKKLKDPRWQRRRLEILQRDDFSCVYCHDKTNELHVHHLTYRSNTDPWDYKDEELITVCVDCHERETDEREGIEKSLLLAFKIKRISSDRLSDFACDLYSTEIANPHIFVDLLQDVIKDNKRLTDAFLEEKH